MQQTFAILSVTVYGPQRALPQDVYNLGSRVCGLPRFRYDADA